jgi:hypothetical protein
MWIKQAAQLLPLPPQKNVVPFLVQWLLPVFWHQSMAGSRCGDPFLLFGDGWLASNSNQLV